MNNINDWFATHPFYGMLIAFALSLFFVPILSPLVSTFWRFIQIPPQKLNVWILKARLASANARLKQARMLVSNQRYLILSCSSCLFVLGSSILSLITVLLLLPLLDSDGSHKAFTVIMTYPFTGSDWIKHQITQQIIFFLFLSYTLFLISLDRLRRIRQAVLIETGTVESLQRKIDKLTSNLEVLSPAAVHGNDGHAH